MAGDRADRRAGAAADDKSTEEADGGEDRARGADGQPPAEPVRRAVAGGLLVLLDDLDFALLVAGDHGGIEVV